MVIKGDPRDPEFGRRRFLASLKALRLSVNTFTASYTCSIAQFLISEITIVHGESRNHCLCITSNSYYKRNKLNGGSTITPRRLPLFCVVSRMTY